MIFSMFNHVLVLIRPFNLIKMIIHAEIVKESCYLIYANIMRHWRGDLIRDYFFSYNYSL